LLLAGVETPDLRSWINVRYALLVRSNASAFTSSAEVIDKLNELAKVHLLDENEWGLGPDAVAGQAGMAALIAQQNGGRA